MPVRFQCPQCRQLLSVATRKAGSEVKCPRCTTPITVPKAEPEPLSVPSDIGPPQPPRLTPPELAMSDLVMFDEVPQIFAERSVATKRSPVREDFGREKQFVAVPRTVLYAQGALIIAVAMLCFGLGFLAGRGAQLLAPADGAREPVVVTGHVHYQAAGGQSLPDDGAVIFAIPQGNPPPQRFRTAGLRPQDPARADAGNNTIRAIESIDGFYQRVTAEGKFELRAKPGKYQVLVISRHVTRTPPGPPRPDDLAELAKFFESAHELIGTARYQLAVVDLPGVGPLEYEFTPGRQ